MSLSESVGSPTSVKKPHPSKGVGTQGAGRPRGRKNKTRSMVPALRLLGINSIEGLLNHYGELNRLIRLAKRRDDPRDAAHVKSLIVQRGNVLRGILPFAYHKQAQIVSVDDQREKPQPVSIKLNLSSSSSDQSEEDLPLTGEGGKR